MAVLPEMLNRHFHDYQIVYRIHATKRMFQRAIHEDDVARVLKEGSIIEQYDEDFPFPSVLINGLSAGNTPFFTENQMKCVICKNGHTEDGFTSVIFERKNTTVVFKKVPAKICDNCGEEYISSEVNKKLLSRARNEVNRGITLEMLEFAA